MSRHVVVGYTATKTGRDAVAFAARLARATGAVLDVSIVLPSADRSVITPPADGYSRVLKEQAQQWIAEAIDRIPDDVVAHAQIGAAESFAAGLVQIADDLGAVCIVVGAADGATRGRHRLGTTTTELLHSSDVPVALVPRGARKVAPETGITRLTVAVGTRPGADALLEATATLAQAARRLLTEHPLPETGRVRSQTLLIERVPVYAVRYVQKGKEHTVRFTGSPARPFALDAPGTLSWLSTVALVVLISSAVAALWATGIFRTH